MIAKLFYLHVYPRVEKLRVPPPSRPKKKDFPVCKRVNHAKKNNFWNLLWSSLLVSAAVLVNTSRALFQRHSLKMNKNISIIQMFLLLNLFLPSGLHWWLSGLSPFLLLLLFWLLFQRRRLWRRVLLLLVIGSGGSLHLRLHVLCPGVAIVSPFGFDEGLGEDMAKNTIGTLKKKVEKDES